MTTPSDPKKRILVAEDDPVSRRLLEVFLVKWGYEVVLATTGLEALQFLERMDAPRLALLDWMMPGMEGVQVCRKLREFKDRPYVYVLLLTARTQKEDLLHGLESGADDYLTKPFEFRELLARLRALLRRPNELRPPRILVGDLELDTASQTAKRGTRSIPLTAKEYALLEYFARNAGRVIGRSEIAEHVWDETFDPFSNLIEVYVNRLRRKLGEEAGKPLLQTRRGSGYVLCDNEAPGKKHAAQNSPGPKKSHA
jgi:two-component system copper resistance phosphate regulon response regulator CusR